MRNQTKLNDINSEGKLVLNSIADVTTDIKNSNKSVQDALVNDIIASINRIKNNITQGNDEERNLNEAIILNVPNQLEKADRRNDEISISGIKSGIEEKFDVKLNISKNNNKKKAPEPSTTTTTTERTTYVEILTIEPNNTNINNTTSLNIIEVLKHLMPMFNSTMTKELHNITIIERDHSKNHSFSATKNVSTIVVTYCDNENYTKANVSFQNTETDLKIPSNNTDDDYLINDDDDEYDYNDFVPEVNLTKNEKKDIMEAAEYGMQKMHELYAVMEPKLYSMGLWLEDSNPARYVAAFNAPSEDAAKFYRYGYASLQAAAKLKQLTRKTIML
ncbi:putative uncharacterized protein DDB_G0289963 [Cydia fagiglandana]|uniref:putative uncharacterized protein DDB_G0289963 n=1 Tax=Cydia fagiglandana TaxID=1458189 RepID=UPI002FEE3FFF